MSEIITEVIDILSRTFSNMPWSGALILLFIVFIIRVAEGDFALRPRRKPRPQYEDDDDEYEWVMVRRRRR